MRTLKITNLIPLTKNIPMPYSQAIKRGDASFQNVYEDLVRKDIKTIN